MVAIRCYCRAPESTLVPDQPPNFCRYLPFPGKCLPGIALAIQGAEFQGSVPTLV